MLNIAILVVLVVVEVSSKVVNEVVVTLFCISIDLENYYSALLNINININTSSYVGS